MATTEALVTSWSNFCFSASGTAGKLRRSFWHGFGVCRRNEAMWLRATHSA